MKHLFTTSTIATAITLGLGSTTAFAQTPTVNVATDPSFVPFEMLDPETGEMIGFDMDIINEVADRAGFDVNLTTMEFSGIIPAVQTGSQEIAIAGTTITEERAQVVDFSDPYYDSGLQIIVRADNEEVSSLGVEWGEEVSNGRGKGRGVREEESNKAPTVEAVFSRIEASEALFRPEIADRGCGGRDVVFPGQSLGA